ncbi:putative malate dehydrogenase 1B [Pelodytes ibericus]
MAKFVIAGKANCPYYAKAELLADYLQKNLPNFRVHKITQHPDEWEQWLMELCEKNGWKHKKSPIIWRELLDRGGKGLLLGGFNDFMEHAKEYYNVTSAMVTAQMKNIAAENLESHIEIQREEEDNRSIFKPLHVWITSASVPTCYSLIPVLASGEVFGMSTEIWLHLLDNTHCMEDLKSLVMEAEDLAFPLLRKVTVHTLNNDAFHQANYVIVLDDILPKEDQSSEAYIKMVASECSQYGALIDQNADTGVKVVVAGSSYVNLKALVISNSAPSIQQHNIVALPTQLEFEAKAEIARKLNVQSSAIKDVIVWGNINGINHLDLHEAKVYEYDSSVWGPPTFSRPLLKMIYDRKWMKNDLLKEWSKRRDHRSGMSAAHCIAKVLSCWQNDSNTGEIVSLGVISEGQFDLPVAIVCCMPVRFQHGDWQVYDQVTVNEEIKYILVQAAKELIKEKAIGLGLAEDDHTITGEPNENTNIGLSEGLSTGRSQEDPLPSVENITDETLENNKPSAENIRDQLEENINNGPSETVINRPQKTIIDHPVGITNNEPDKPVETINDETAENIDNKNVENINQSDTLS